MNIGIDMDGVLTDIQGFNMKHAPPFFLKNFGREVADDSHYDIRDVFDCTEEEFVTYWKKHLIKYAIMEPVQKDARKVVHALRKDGHSIYIISKRVFSSRDDFLGKLMRLIVRNWLWRNRIRFKEIVFCDNDIADSKKFACILKEIDVMVDDEVVNIETIAPVAKVICFDATYNRSCEGDNIIRAKNWDEVYEIIKGLA